ncbi:MAG: TIGR03364 family FAD-dependent oxidoreductase [Isosphaeraceae bacterium]
MSGRADVAVIGGGILGLAFAWTAARQGRSVVLFERGRIAQGASVRNFGMVWPIGQPAGELHQRSLRSRALWDEASQSAGIDLDPCGSIHLAYHPDEMAVLEEFAGRARELGYACRLGTPEESVRFCPAARRAGLLGSLISETEACVDPRQAIGRLPHWLHERFGVDLQFGTAVAEVSMPQVRATDGRTWTVGRTVVCGGADLQTLFPEVFVRSGIRLCKLQMMRTAPQPNGFRIGTMVAGGLTLCHYPTFQVCPSLAALRARFESTMAEFVGLGIHVMASQNALGEVVIGDSHEYDDAIEPFDKTRIDALILGHLATMIDLPDPAVAARWHGIYAKHPEKPLFVANPQPEAYVVTAPGGSGMTMSFGHAEAVWNTWTG